MSDTGLEVEERDGALLLKPLPLAGRLAALQACVKAVEGRTETLVVLDLSEIRDLSSADLGVLVAVGQVVSSRHGRLRLAGLRPSARQALEASRLATHLPVFADVAAALAAP
jgi:anti-anti-sigma factor